MGFQSGMTSASGICKPFPSNLTSSSSSGRLVRRRGRGSLVRCRAFVWSREDLDHLHNLSMLPRHQLSKDVVEQHVNDLDYDHQKKKRIVIRQDSHPLEDLNMISQSPSDHQHQENFSYFIEKQNKSTTAYREHCLQDDNRQVNLDEQSNQQNDQDDTESSSSDLQESNSNTKLHSITGISATLIDLSL